MYEITLNGQTLYHPTSIDCVVTKAVLHEALNDAGYMEITIPHTNPCYEEAVERVGKVILYKDNVPNWYGVIRDVSIDFSKNKTIYVVGEATYLNDTVQNQVEYKEKSKYEIFSNIIAQHNSMVEDEKKFQVGIVGKNAQKMISVVTDWQYTLDAIREHICEEEEYFRIRHIGNQKIIDIMPLEDYGRRSDQDILFGDNLLDYAEESSGTEIASVCIPLGVRLDEGGIEGVDNYLTCASANDGKNYIVLENAMKRLGYITKVVHFNVLDTPEALLTAGTNWLKEAQYAKLTLNLTAVDLSILHSDIDNYSVGDYVHAICEPMGMDSWFPIRERETDILDLANNKIKVGSVGVKSFTAQQMETYDELERLMPNKDSILEQAKKNATALINGAGKEGHVVLHTNEAGVVYEILIMDTDDINTARKIWRWNENGFGYSNDGGKTFGLAMTMDGAIVADYITTGRLIGLDINNGNGTFHVDSNGNMSASNASIKGNITGSSISGGTISGAKISGGTISGATYTQSGGRGTIKIDNGWIVGDSSIDAGAAIEMRGHKDGDHSTLFGSYYFTHAIENQLHIQARSMNVAQAGKDKESDRRVKHDINDVDTEISKKFIADSKPCSFRYNDIPNQLRFGFIAQDVQENIKQCGFDDAGIVYDCGDILALNYQEYIPHLVNCIKDLQKQINELKGENND